MNAKKHTIDTYNGPIGERSRTSIAKAERRDRAAKRFHILSRENYVLDRIRRSDAAFLRYDRNFDYGTCAPSVGEQQDREYAAYVQRKLVEAKALGLPTDWLVAA